MSPSAAGQVLLLQPWVEDFYATEHRAVPLGLGYLAASLRRRFPRLEVAIHDTLAGGGRRMLPWPPEFDYLRAYYRTEDRGPLSLFRHYWRFGQDDATIRSRLRGHRPMLIGISSLFTPYYRQSLALAALCRGLFPAVPIVMGGSHATLHPETLLAGPDGRGADGGRCDLVLRGECEDAICELVDHLLGGRSAREVSGLVDPATVAAPPPPARPDRAALPNPIYPGLRADDYRYRGRRMAFLLTSRSCPHRCSFCSIHSVFGRRYEVRPVDAVIDEIERLHARGVRHFDFEDDNLTFDRERALDLLRRIEALDLEATFSSLNGLSYHSLDGELLAAMRRIGYRELHISLVSADRSVLDLARRPHTVARFLSVVEAARRLDLRTTAYAILGMPGQTTGEMLATLRLLAAAPCLPGASPFYFTPGSPIHRREASRPGLRLASRDRDPCFSARLTALDVETEAFDRDDVYSCFRLARLIHHVKRGLDRGHPADHPWHDAAREVFRTGRWGPGAGGRPVSSRVARELRAAPLRIAGGRGEAATDLLFDG